MGRARSVGQSPSLVAQGRLILASHKRRVHAAVLGGRDLLGGGFIARGREIRYELDLLYRVYHPL